MARIAVFDSGLGSLSLIGPIRRAVRADLVYLADRRSYPYGAMRAPELRAAVASSIRTLRDRFSPDIIVVGSNTPSLLAPELLGGRVLGVLPPVRRAARISKTRRIAVLATRSASRSGALLRHIREQTAGTGCTVTRIDATKLVDLVETGKFVTRRAHCARLVRDVLAATFARDSIDAATLSSTHLPLLAPVLRDVFPDVSFVDPGPAIAARIARLAGSEPPRARLRVYATGGARKLEAQLARMGLARRVEKI